MHSQKPPSFKKLKLSPPLIKAIRKKGYRSPTPIQTKTIPLVLAGRDVIATSRTGSGKTAAFLLPLLHILGGHSAEVHPRALVLSPTRELAVQTHSYLTALGRFTDLHACLLVGGESFDEQFFALRNDPDIVIATPGRLFHILNETDFSLEDVGYLVIDEADRLFELGFSSQLNFILSKINAHRQTMLFSATLPKILSEFSKAALRSPVLVELEGEMILNESLKNIFLSIRSEQKFGALLLLLRHNEQMLVFCSTRHCVEFLQALLVHCGIPSAACYGKMDQTMRRQNLEEFKQKKAKALLVTDLAARGLDLPQLGATINFSFPAEPRLFIHRVGRVARLGRSGTAFSLVEPEEKPYLVEVASHLGIDLMSAPNEFKTVPEVLLDPCVEECAKAIETVTEIQSLFHSHKNAEKLYYRTRPAASRRSMERSKELAIGEDCYHPFFVTLSKNPIKINKTEINFKSAIKNYKSKSTIFETGPDNKTAKDIMSLKRDKHFKFVQTPETPKSVVETATEKPEQPGKAEKAEDFPKIPKTALKLLKIRKPKSFCDEKHFMSWSKKGKSEWLKEEDGESENGIDENVVEFLEIGPDEADELNKKRYKKWNMKRRKFELVTEVDGKILKERSKLSKQSKKDSALQKAWSKTKSAAITKNTVDRWGGPRKQRYVKRIVFDADQKERKPAQKKKTKKQRKLKTKAKTKAAGPKTGRRTKKVGRKR